MKYNSIFLGMLGYGLLLFQAACSKPELKAEEKNDGAAAKEVNSAPASNTKDNTAMKIESPAFSHQGEIPGKYTCEGEDISPQLSWDKAPAGTKSFALIVDDPDAPDPAAPKRVWVHWVMYNIPASSHGLAEGTKSAPDGARDGKNDWGRTGYGGPCPPIGRHRYFHKLYALDTVLPDIGNATKAELLEAMKGHILSSSELVGTYIKKANR